MCFELDTPPDQVQASNNGLSESCPKNGDVPKSPFPTVAALVPSAGTLTLHKDSRSDAGAVGVRLNTCPPTRRTFIESEAMENSF